MRKSKNSRKPASSLDRLIHDERQALDGSAQLTSVANLLWLLQALAVAWVLGRMVEQRADAGDLALAVTIFLAVGVLRAVLDHVAGGRAFAAAERVMHRVRTGLVTREALAGVLHPRKLGSPAIAALAAQKADLLAPYLTRYRPARYRAVLVPLAILAASFWASWVVALILLVAGPLIPVFMALVGLAAKEASEKQMVQIGQLNDLLMERLSALADIRLLNAGERVVDEFAAEAEDLRARTMAVLRVAFLSSTVLELFSAIGVAMVAVFVGFSLLGQIGFGAWQSGLSPLEGIFVLLLAPEFFQPMRDLAAAWHDKAAADAVAEELAALEDDLPPSILGTGRATDPLGGPATLSVRGLTILWPDGSTRDVPDFDLRAGASLAIMGSSGVGKSSLLAVLAGLERPGEGEVRVAGVALDDTTADQWRKRLGWVPQAPHFLNATLRQNITFGVPDPDRLARALDDAAFSGVVARMPRGLETRLGETGAGLSGGEARRATIARALFAAPDVVLADEPTADLDPATAAQVIAGLKALSKRGASVIAVTHDPAVADALDQVLVLEGGA